MSWHAADPLGDGLPRDAFGVWALLEHGVNLYAATPDQVFFSGLIVALSVWQSISSGPQHILLLGFLTLLSIVGGALFVLTSLHAPFGDAQAQAWNQA